MRTSTCRTRQAFADAFAGRFLANGGKAETSAHIVQTDMAQQQQFFLLMRGYLALGLIVGIAGIGVIMVRAVRERRRQVGVLRALGFQAAAVRGAFVVESAFVAVEGVLIGTVLALVCAWSITLTDAFGSTIAFRIPFAAIGLLVLGTLLFALIATAAPAPRPRSSPPSPSASPTTNRSNLRHRVGYTPTLRRIFGSMNGGEVDVDLVVRRRRGRRARRSTSPTAGAAPCALSSGRIRWSECVPSSGTHSARVYVCVHGMHALLGRREPVGRGDVVEHRVDVPIARPRA